MSFLFSRKPSVTDIKKNEKFIDYQGMEIGSFQPNNPFRDLLLLPTFPNTVSIVFPIENENKFIVGDDQGNLTIWNSEYGTLLTTLKVHTTSITGITRIDGFNETAGDFIAVSSSEKLLSVWNIDTFELINTTKFTANASKLFLNFEYRSSDLLIVAGLDLKIYDRNLELIDEYFRKTRENTIKHIIKVDEDQFIVATNCDLEVYKICEMQKSIANDLNGTKEDDMEKSIKLKEIIKHKNAHKDSILCINKISDKVFASGSSDGALTMWYVKGLTKMSTLQPFSEMIESNTMHKLNSTSISCIRSISDDRYLIICSGVHLSVYDNNEQQFAYQIANAHNSKITSLLLLENTIITSAEDGSIRVWAFSKTFCTKNDAESTDSEIKLDLIGECLGHSTTIATLNTVTDNEILSVDFDNMLIIWRDADIADRNRKIHLSQIVDRFNNE